MRKNMGKEAARRSAQRLYEQTGPDLFEPDYDEIADRSSRLRKKAKKKGVKVSHVAAERAVARGMVRDIEVKLRAAGLDSPTSLRFVRSKKAPGHSPLTLLRKAEKLAKNKFATKLGARIARKLPVIGAALTIGGLASDAYAAYKKRNKK